MTPLARQPPSENHDAKSLALGKTFMELRQHRRTWRNSRNLGPSWDPAAHDARPEPPASLQTLMCLQDTGSNPLLALSLLDQPPGHY